jgi:hypothetical protein
MSTKIELVDPTVSSVRENVWMAMGSEERGHYFDWLWQNRRHWRYCLTLTHDRPISSLTSNKRLDKLVKMLGLHRMTYAHVSGCQPGTVDRRVDHHLLLPVCIDQERIEKWWPHGKVHIAPVRDVLRMVGYMCTRNSEQGPVVYPSR